MLLGMIFNNYFIFFFQENDEDVSEQPALHKC